MLVSIVCSWCCWFGERGFGIDTLLADEVFSVEIGLDKLSTTCLGAIVVRQLLVYPAVARVGEDGSDSQCVKLDKILLAHGCFATPVGGSVMLPVSGSSEYQVQPSTLQMSQMVLRSVSLWRESGSKVISVSPRPT